MAADSVTDRTGGAAAGPERPWRCGQPAMASGPPVLRPEGPGDDQGLAADGPRRGELEHAIEVVVVGGPGSLEDVLTDDAVGWSPTLRFSSRAAAEDALRDRVASLAVLRFRVDRLCWAAPFAFAEWHLEAVQTDPLLVGDDVLIEGTGRHVSLAGASVVELRGDRIAGVRTYFDDASLIEQVVLGP